LLRSARNDETKFKRSFFPSFGGVRGGFKYHTVSQKSNKSKFRQKNNNFVN
jgi:hypothetical protein